ncbi:MAG: Gfo/Idh/MocA family oxidoreductase [Anaerolineales bacterium]|nr:Gfo/Idh/MocA family oxidoreductase [Anaerolineales bacterium]
MSAASQSRSASPRILICGLGSIGRRHLRNLQALGVDDLVLLRSGKATLPDEELAGIPVAHDLAAALDRWKPAGVIVSNPTSLHAETALAALRAGSHVLLEKPVSASADLIPALLRAERESAARVLVGYQFRYHPGLAAIQGLLNDRTIGKPVSVSVHWGEYLPGWHPWEDYRRSYSARKDLGGGVVNTLSHPIDYLRWLLGDVSYVTALLTSAGGLEMDVEDTGTLLLEFDSGVHGVVHLNYNQRPPRHDLEIVGTQGSIRWDNSDGSLRWWSEGMGDWACVMPPDGFERNTLFMDEADHFLAVMKGDERPRCSLLDGIRALEITQAAHQSQAVGARVKIHKLPWEQEVEE